MQMYKESKNTMRIKKIVSVSLIIAMIFSMTACGNSGQNIDENDGSEITEAIELEEEEALDEYEAAENDVEISTESSLKGTGPATLRLRACHDRQPWLCRPEVARLCESQARAARCRKSQEWQQL